jgi:hypothetical protein
MRDEQSPIRAELDRFGLLARMVQSPVQSLAAKNGD